MQNDELFRKNLELYDQLQKLNYDYEQVNRELDVCKQKIAELTEQLHRKLESCNTTIKTETSVSPKSIQLSDDVVYGAEVIGKIVVEAAKKANALTAEANIDNKELVNLILGRTEVEKANILNIISSEYSDKEKYLRINECFNNAIEYFEDIIAQKG